MRDDREIEREEDRLRDAVARLPPERRRALYEKARSRIKDPDTYAALNWSLPAGLHHFYLGRAGRGAATLAGFLAGLVLIVSSAVALGLFLVLGILALETWELLRAQAIVRRHNNRVTRQLLEEEDAAGPGAAPPARPPDRP
jgi:hypothetical protein